MDRWTWSHRALGPVTAKTPFAEDALAPLLPGYRLVFVEACEGPGTAVFRAFAPGGREPALVFTGHRSHDCVVAVRVRELGRIPNAWSIGSRFGETLLRPEDCFATNEVPGREGDIFCRETGEVWGPIYWFRTGLADTGGILPQRATICDSLLYEIAWTPLPG